MSVDALDIALHWSAATHVGHPVGSWTSENRWYGNLHWKMKRMASVLGGLPISRLLHRSIVLEEQGSSSGWQERVNPKRKHCRTPSYRRVTLSRGMR